MRFFYAFSRPSGMVPEGLFLFGFDLMADIGFPAVG
jgi:hypothetical protein